MSPDALAPIAVIAHYNLLERIDAAGPGDLYRARDTRHGRTVAVRVLPADFTTDQTALLDSMRAVQVLSHLGGSLPHRLMNRLTGEHAQEAPSAFAGDG